MDMISWAFNFIPWWVWVVAVLILLGFTVQFWTPIWAVLPRPVKIVLGALAALIAAYVAGRNRGAKDERDQRAAANARALQTRAEVDHEVASKSDADLDRDLNGWMRD